MHKQDGLAKEVGQQNGQPDLCVVLQPMENGGGRQEQASKNLTQHLYMAHFCSAVLMHSEDNLNCVAVSISLTLQAALLVDRTAVYEASKTVSIIRSEECS